MELKIDKSAWVSVTLGEVAFEVSDRIDAPAESEYDRFVGLEHFVSGEVKIQKWESTRSLVSAAKAFRKGDVLFARRNAYLRRASMVDFDGCCSGDAYVFRENNEVIVPGLLPFIVNSNSLWDFANSNAAGTMSKRVKWKDLANYKFLLPPKDQQAEIAELLWAQDDMQRCTAELRQRIEVYHASKTHSYLDGKRGKFSSDKCKMYKLEEVAGYRRGSFPQPYGNSEWYDSENGMPFVQVYDISDEMKLKDKTKQKISELAQPKSVHVPSGSLIISIQGSIGRVAVTHYDCFIDRTILVFTSFKLPLDIAFFSHALKYLFERKKKTAPGATIKTITKAALSEFKIAIPDLRMQEQMSGELLQIENSIAAANLKDRAAKDVRSATLNAFFGHV